MHILHILNGYKPAYRLGGTVFTGFEIAERQVRLGHRVTVFASNSNLDEDLAIEPNVAHDVSGVSVWYFARRELVREYLPFIPYLSRSSGFLYTPEMKRALEKIMPSVDLVHAHAPFTYPMIAASRVAFRFERPLVYQQHGVFDPGRLQYRGAKKRLYIRMIEKPIMDRASVLLALTEAEVASYRALGVKTDCRVVPNGVDANQYGVDHPEPGFLPKQITSSSFVVLFMSRMHPQKGASRLLEAFLSCHHQLPNPVLVLAGPDEYGFETQFRDQVRERGAESRVVFAGMVNGDIKRHLLSRANLFCLPSDGEGFSMAILEALASRTPVLISPQCHFPDVETAQAGFVVDSSPSSLTKALQELSARPEELKACGERGRALVESRYTWDRVVNQLLSVYETACAKQHNHDKHPVSTLPPAPTSPARSVE